MTGVQIFEATVARGLTPVQVVNSVRRSAAHAQLHGSAIQKATFNKALVLAETALQAALAEGFVPCGAECMGATETRCECFCGGKNHGLAVMALAS